MASLRDGVGGLLRHSEVPEGILAGDPGKDRTSLTVSTLELDWASSGKVDAEDSSVFLEETVATLGDGVGGLPLHSKGPEWISGGGPLIQGRTSLAVSTLVLAWASSGRTGAEVSSVLSVGNMASLGDGVGNLL